MVFWLDSVGTLSAIPLIDTCIKIFSFFDSSGVQLMQGAFLSACSFCHRKQSFLYDFPFNIHVILFKVYDFHASAFLQSSVYRTCTAEG